VKEETRRSFCRVLESFLEDVVHKDFLEVAKEATETGNWEPVWYAIERIDTVMSLKGRLKCE